AADDHAGTFSQAGATARGALAKPARRASMFSATCWARYEGSASVTAAASDSTSTMAVTAAYAPSMTIDAVITLPTSTARSDAGTSMTVQCVRSRAAAPRASNTVVLTRMTL